MTTTIADKGAVIQLTIDTQVRNIIKAQIVEVSVIKTNIIKIDIRMGALDNIYIPFADVTQPITANPEALRDLISSYLPTSGSVAGAGATESKQIEEINLLNTVNTSVQEISNTLRNMDSRVFQQPLLEDNSGAGVIYLGYANPGTPAEDASWAIQRIQKLNGISIHKWSSGSKDLKAKWSERESLDYK